MPSDPSRVVSLALRSGHRGVFVRPGIVIQHAQDRSREGDVVRSDVTGFIGIVPKARWPNGVKRGDFLEIAVGSLEDLRAHPMRVLVDGVTRRALKAYFENGGKVARVIAVAVEGPEDLVVEERLEQLFAPVMDRLRAEEDIALLAMPVLAFLPTEVRGGQVNGQALAATHLLLRHCREMNNRFLLVDAPRQRIEGAEGDVRCDLDADAMFKYVAALRNLAGESAAYGAIYYPWIQAGDEAMPPSGAVAGVFARSDAEHGPFGVRWPPANMPMRGVTHPSVEVAWSATGAFAEHGVNPIVTRPGVGVVMWGARTMSTDARWVHINSRRIVSFITEQMRRDAEWVVFEQQRPELWETLGRMLRARLDTFWSAGLLTGQQAGEQYLVQCDAELNPPAVRDAGQIHVKVMLKPVSTAESITVDLRLGA
jgi:hypothetical protein